MYNNCYIYFLKRVTCKFHTKRVNSIPIWCYVMYIVCIMCIIYNASVPSKLYLKESLNALKKICNSFDATRGKIR